MPVIGLVLNRCVKNGPAKRDTIAQRVSLGRCSRRVSSKNQLLKDRTIAVRKGSRVAERGRAQHRFALLHLTPS